MTKSNNLTSAQDSELYLMLPVDIRYNTRSNKVRVIKTPGGKLRYLHIKKKGSPPKCGDCGIKLPGVGFPSFGRGRTLETCLKDRKSNLGVEKGWGLRTGLGPDRSTRAYPNQNHTISVAPYGS